MAQDGLNQLAPVRDIQAITPHATNDIPVTAGIRSESGGAVTMRLIDSNADVTITLLAGVDYWYRVKYVRVAGTVATGIYGLYN